jgi:hypothetical protein
MKQLLHTISALFFVFVLLSANTSTVLAGEGDNGHPLEAEVNGYHVALSSHNEWAKGENTIFVTLTDGMDMRVRDVKVELLIAPKSDGHAESEAGGHGQSEADTHGSESQHDPMPDMDMGESASETPAHGEASMDPVAMTESDEHGVYMAETHFESSGEHDIHVMFHVNGEMLQANFVVEIPGTNSKTVVLWSFFLVNVALITSAGVLKQQSLSAKRQVMA